MSDDDLAGKLRGVMHGAEPALSDGELATLEEAKDRLAETGPKPDRNSEPGDEVSITLRPRVDFTHFASDLRTLADEIECMSAREAQPGEPRSDGGTISEAELQERKQATSGPTMVRVNFRLPRHLREAVDDAVEAGRYPNRSAALRAAVRETFVATDGGAVDHDYDEAARTPAEILFDEYGATDAPTHGELSAGDVAIDLVTRQALVVRDCVADDLATYYDEHDFDLLNYKQHRWLPVGIDDPVYECVFVGDVEGLHKFSNTYDYPASRLARVPVELAGGED